MMLSRIVTISTASLFGVALLASSGCCETSKGSYVATTTKTCKAPCGTKISDPCPKPAGELAAELPPYAKPGECYAKVFVPPTFKTVTERIMVRQASERVEIVPAKYDWVEERILVKDASTELSATPAEFAVREQTIQTAPGHTDWEVNKAANCDLPKGQPAKDVFCLVRHDPQQTTIRTEVQVKAACVESTTIPAEYQTVRRQKLVSAAATRKVCIPAEFETVEKSVKVCDGRMAWKKVVCELPEIQTTSATPNRNAITLNAGKSYSVNTGR